MAFPKIITQPRDQLPGTVARPSSDRRSVPEFGHVLVQRGPRDPEQPGHRGHRFVGAREQRACLPSSGLTLRLHHIRPIFGECYGDPVTRRRAGTSGAHRAGGTARRAEGGQVRPPPGGQRRHEGNGRRQGRRSAYLAGGGRNPGFGHVPREPVELRCRQHHLPPGDGRGGRGDRSERVIEPGGTHSLGRPPHQLTRQVSNRWSSWRRPRMCAGSGGPTTPRPPHRIPARGHRRIRLPPRLARLLNLRARRRVHPDKGNRTSSARVGPWLLNPPTRPHNRHLLTPLRMPGRCDD